MTAFLERFSQIYAAVAMVTGKSSAADSKLRVSQSIHKSYYWVEWVC